ncbi:MAG TPA: hypothetical protein VN892_05555 [Solirubrobacteraceae bacterium]|nr:hypothetical protein [Solirubrobacteraceae bacterium]
MENTEPSYWFVEGLDAASEGGYAVSNSMVILDFGGQLGNGKGTKLEDGIDVTNEEIEVIAEEFADGYYINEFAYTTLHLDIGTNNSDSVSKARGKAWAELVKHVASFVLEEPDKAKYVSIYGGDDLEDGSKLEGWSSGSNTLGWAKEYSKTTESPYVDYGSAGACPEATYEKTTKGGACDELEGAGGWDQRVEYELAWEIERAHAAPDIYYPPTKGDNAGQWAEVGAYGRWEFGGGIQFEGPLDENGYKGTNKSEEAWEQFEKAVNENGLNESMSFSLTI